MSPFDGEHFQKFTFAPTQLGQFQQAAARDLHIAQDSSVPEVVFKFAYDTLIKCGITLIAREGYRVRSAPGHHAKLIDHLAELLNNQDIAVFGHKMRTMRNLDFYDGGILISEKDAQEYLKFVRRVFKQAFS